ncbi:hypothetical protein [Eudoraea sp.]|uniref:hypothetical protein n=1 Tax=Eudoraea sp. TaxID=1979955 RepID=UPI003C72691B
MKTKNNFLKTTIAILVLAFAISCGKDEIESVIEPTAIDPVQVDPCDDPCANPNQCPGQCVNENTGLNRDAFLPEGTVTDTDNGYTVDGKLTIPIDSIGEIVFDNADIDVSFNDDGTLQSLVGNVQIPPLENYFEFAQPLDGEVGFFSGKFLNENRNYEITLKDERSYFVFNIQANFELKVGANDNPDDTKAISISPGSAGLTLITDYTDPMFFFSVGGNVAGGDGENNNNNSNNSDSSLLGVSFGGSFGANMTYVPTNPVNDVISFDAKRVRGGSISFFKILEGSGLYYENKGFNADIDLKEPLESDFGVGYRGGWNGKIDLALEITSFINFGFPIAEGSAAIVAEASTNNGINTKAFINGIADPDLSWYPDFIPIKPDGSLSADGFIEQSGDFDIGVAGTYSIEVPNHKQGIEGLMRLSNPAFEIDGKFIKDDEEWSVNANIKKEESEVLVKAPTSFVAGLDTQVAQKIDSVLSSVENVISDLENATADYEFELSLRGLREALPVIISNAQKTINDRVADEVADGVAKAKAEVSSRGAVYCSDNISAIANSVVKPYRDVLARMGNAVSNQNDNDQTRVELEAALRQLASLNRVNKTVTATVTWGLPITGCAIPFTSNRNISLNFEVLTSTQVTQLTTAANNVKFIAETSDIKISAQAIFDAIPTQEIRDRLDKLKQDIMNQVKTYQDFNGVGFNKNHTSSEFTFFIEQGNERKTVTSFNPFNPDAIIKILIPDLQ